MKSSKVLRDLAPVCVASVRFALKQLPPEAARVPSCRSAIAAAPGANATQHTALHKNTNRVRTDMGDLLDRRPRGPRRRIRHLHRSPRRPKAITQMGERATRLVSGGRHSGHAVAVPPI